MAQRWIKRIGYFCALFVCLATHTYSQEVQFRIQPEMIRVGEMATIEFTIRGNENIGRPQLPPIDGLQITHVGQTVQHTISSLNGREKVTTHKYSVLPIKPGNFTIGPFTFKAGKAEYGIPAVKLNVLAPGGSGQGAKNGEVDWDSLIFATMETKTPTVYNQQFLDIEFSIYHRSNLRLDSQVQPLQLPTAGLAIKEMKELGRTREEVNGEIYEVRRFAVKFQAITEGDFTLKPSLRTYILVDKPKRRSGSIFDEMFGAMNRYEKHPIDLTPKPLELHVKAIPAKDRPASFNGAVGEYAMDIKLTPQVLQAGDPVTVRTIISGQGNMDTLTAPKLIVGDDFRVYESKLISKELNTAGSSGRKIFEQVIIPRKAGDVALPPLSFSFFNPTLKTFVELKKDGLILNISESSQPNPGVLVSASDSASSQTLEVVDLDIAYLKSLPRTWTRQSGSSPIQRLQRPWLFALSPLILAGTYALTRQRRSREGNVLLKRREAAPKKARAGIQQAQSALGDTDYSAYYESVHQAISDFYRDRLGWAPGEFDPGFVCKHLQQQQAPTEDIELIRTVLVHAESLRYGAGLTDAAQQDATQGQLDQISTILKRSERS